MVIALRRSSSAAVAVRHTVMQVVPDLDIGGAQETARTLAAHLPGVGRPTVVTTFRDGPLRREIEALGVPVEVLPDRRHSVVALPLFLAEMARRRRDLLALVERHRVGVIQTQGLGTLDFLVMTLRRRGRLQVWWTIQNANFLVRAEHLPGHRWFLRPKRTAHRLLYRFGARIVDGIIAVSDETAASFRRSVGNVGGRITVVCNAVDVERYPAGVDREAMRRRLGLAPGEHAMTMVGTFKRQKGHRDLIEAAARVIPRFPHLRILLVGDGELAGEIRGQVEEARIADRVLFLGSRRDVPEILAASDSFVLASLWEGLPVALVEAMASRLPVIATAVSGTRQVMVDGQTGWMVPPGDPAALGCAMVEVLSRPGRASAMATAGRTRVASSFGAADQARRLARLFDERAAG
jgi:glycosyltransferase involved in cell wall biosynthesis